MSGRVEWWKGGMVERWSGAVATAVRLALGWHLAYLGVWALTSAWSFSWFGRFQCAHWIGGGLFRALAGSPAMGAVDVALAWGLLVTGVLLMLGRAVKPAAAFGVFYLALMYVLNPPHFGHTGESHFLFVDRNVIEVAMLFFVMGWKGGEVEKCEGGEVREEVSK